MPTLVGCYCRGNWSHCIRSVNSSRKMENYSSVKDTMSGAPLSIESREPPCRQRASHSRHRISNHKRNSVGDVVMRRIGLQECPYCSSHEVYESQGTTCRGRASGLLLLRVVRCHGCMRRHYGPIWVPALEYPTLSVKKQAQAVAHEDKQKCSA